MSPSSSQWLREQRALAMVREVTSRGVPQQVTPRGKGGCLLSMGSAPSWLRQTPTVTGRSCPGSPFTAAPHGHSASELGWGSGGQGSAGDRSAPLPRN